MRVVWQTPQTRVPPAAELPGQGQNATSPCEALRTSGAPCTMPTMRAGRLGGAWNANDRITWNRSHARAGSFRGSACGPCSCWAWPVLEFGCISRPEMLGILDSRARQHHPPRPLPSNHQQQKLIRVVRCLSQRSVHAENRQNAKSCSTAPGFAASAALRSGAYRVDGRTFPAGNARDASR